MGSVISVVSPVYGCTANLEMLCLKVHNSFEMVSVPGWTTTVMSVWFLSGLIMATLGVHGFYISRIFAEVKKRPRIVVETTTSERNR